MCILFVYNIYIIKSCWLLWFEYFVHVSDGFPKKMDSGVGELSSIHFYFLEYF